MLVDELAAYGNVMFRLLVGFVIVLCYIRVAGRMQLAPITAVDQIGNMALGGMVGTFVLNSDSSITLFIFMLVVWAGLMIGLRWLKHRFRALDEFIDGRRLELVRDGAFIASGFRAAQLSVHEFVTKMNQQKIVSFDDIQSVWLEPGGQFTILQNDDTPLSTVIIEEGKVDVTALASIGHDLPWLEAELARRNYASAAEVFCADWHSDALWTYPYMRIDGNDTLQRV